MRLEPLLDRRRHLTLARERAARRGVHQKKRSRDYGEKRRDRQKKAPDG
jgi:hypothetical protein